MGVIFLNTFNINISPIITMVTLRWQKLTDQPSTCCIESHDLNHIVSRSLRILFVPLMLVAEGWERKGKKWCCQRIMQLDVRSSLRLGATRGIRLGKMWQQQSQTVQTYSVNADVQKLLGRQFGERTVSVCQHVAMRQSRLSECK